MKVLMAAWNKGFTFMLQVSLEGMKEIVMKLRRNFSSFLPE